MRSSMLATALILALIGSRASAAEWPGGPFGSLFGPDIWRTPEVAQRTVPSPLRRFAVIPTAHAQIFKEEPAARTYDDILPIGLNQTSSDARSITPGLQSQRLAPPEHRIVAPNAWSAPLYR